MAHDPLFVRQDVLLILAGHFRQAEVLARDVLRLKQPYQYIAGERQLDGFFSGTVLRWGTWYERPDRREIMDLIRAKHMTVLDVTDQRHEYRT